MTDVRYDLGGVGDGQWRADGTCIKVLSVAGIVKFVSASGLKLIEADSEDQLTGKPYLDVWPSESRPMIAQALAEAAAGKIAVVEGYAPTLKGNPRYWEISFYSVFRGGQSEPDIIGVSRDISAQREQAMSHLAPGARLGKVER